MVMALKWVRENIKSFNGDPENVTISGQSAGSAATHLLVLSPLAKGLFHKAIMQSGCALNPWVPAKRCGMELAEALNLQTENEVEIFETLKTLPGEMILEAEFKTHAVRFISVLRQPLTVLFTGNRNRPPKMLRLRRREKPPRSFHAETPLGSHQVRGLQQSPHDRRLHR